jgi:hypothetical protein
LSDDGDGDVKIGDDEMLGTKAVVMVIETQSGRIRHAVTRIENGGLLVLEERIVVVCCGVMRCVWILTFGSSCIIADAMDFGCPFALFMFRCCLPQEMSTYSLRRSYYIDDDGESKPDIAYCVFEFD